MSDHQNSDHEEPKAINGLPFVSDIKAPPRQSSERTEQKEYIEHSIKQSIPHKQIEHQFISKEVEVPKDVVKTVPIVSTLHRKLAVEKPVYNIDTIEVPQTHIVDRIHETFNDIEKEKLVEVEDVIIQERLIPIPKREVKHVTKKLPRSEYNQIVSSYQLHTEEKFDEQLFKNTSEPKLKSLMELMNDPYAVQHTSPTFRHSPKPLEIPMIHYKANPVERIVDRCVPVPVELEVKQEYLCPTLIPVWEERVITVHYTRVIEKPVPIDAFSNKTLMNMYLKQTNDIDKKAEDNWRKGKKSILSGKSNRIPILDKMTVEDCETLNLNFGPSFTSEAEAGTVRVIKDPISTY